MITLISLIACVGISSAGEGGFVYLINLSGSDWIRTHHDSQAMNNWGFPKLVKDKSEVHVYIEFSYVPFARISHARVDYKLVGTEGKRFHIVALENPRRLEAVYDNLETDGQPLGMRRNLGWRREGDTNLIIIGKNGTYTGTCLNGSNWMKNNMDILGSRTLKQISIPGSHHSGMSKLDGNTDFGRPCTVLTQSNNIEEQLHLGIRYFDIRPVIANSNLFLTGHYTLTNGSWEGANGQSITSIVSDLNVFTKDHNELIIMKLSHPLNIDVKSKIYRKFNQTDWNKMFLQLDKITHLYTNEISYVNLTDITLNDYTKHGSRASVVIIVDDPDSNVELGSRLGRGYFKPSNLDMYDDPSGNNDWSEMIDDQIKKMHQHSQNKYFLLSWTLTQSALQAAMCIPSLRELADLANIQLGKSLYSEASASSYPNIILVDNVKDTNVASLALAINTKIML